MKFLLFFILLSDFSAMLARQYDLSTDSEEYNTFYFYKTNFNRVFENDTLIIVNKIQPSSFVIETNFLENDKQIFVLYNTGDKICIQKVNGRYKVDGIVCKFHFVHEHKISIYIVGRKMLFYVDDQCIYIKKIDIDTQKNVGVLFPKGSKCLFLNCYEPIPFANYDYGANIDNNSIRLTPQNVGEEYNLTFLMDDLLSCRRLIRFEYRFDDILKKEKNGVLRSRSEISGVFSKSPLNKWIIDYDILIPSGTADDERDFEIITQIHEHSKDPISPSFCLFVQTGYLFCGIRGDSIPIGLWEKRNIPTHQDVGKLIYFNKNEWYHIKIFIKEGYQCIDEPLTKVWVNSHLFFESKKPNCYNYEPIKDGFYNYLKFGIYKPGWLETKKCEFNKRRRIYIFRNFVVRC